MKYSNVKKGIFIERPNRFTAKVEIDGKTETVHVKNTGRCRELLIPGAIVYLTKSDNPERKTAYDLVAVEKERENKTPLLVNMDSQIPNDVVEEWLKKGLLFKEGAKFKREVKKGDSRFDFMIEEEGRISYLEVKGVTLEKDGIALFPDAPTERGVKHIKELCKCVDEGFEAYICFVIQTEKVKYFTPNRRTHPQFADALLEAKEKGVNILCVNCIVEEDCLEINTFVDVKL